MDDSDRTTDLELYSEDLLIELVSGTRLEADVWTPKKPPNSQRGNKLAICLHPWSWFGGRKDDPTLSLLVVPLVSEDYHVIRYNSRGVGNSSGWPSFTGFREVKDLKEVVDWAMQRISDVRSLVIVGYSHGSLIASMFPVLPSVKTSHLLLSYPLGPKAWLTLFNSSSYTRALDDVLQHPGSNVLVVFGNKDEFTSYSKYKEWAIGLRGNVEVVEVEHASHFWHGRSARILVDTVRRWLP